MAAPTDPVAEAQTTACSSCSAPIKWVRTERGKHMPVDAKPTTLLVATGGHGPQGTPNVTSRRGWVSHFATCPNADQHRRERR